MSQDSKILVTLPSGEVRKYGLQIDAIRIGRAADNTVVIEDPSLSGHHCVMRKVGNGTIFNIEDLESTNGIEVNGEPVDQIELKHGDVVKIGEIMIVFLQGGRPPIDPAEPFVKEAQIVDENDIEDEDFLIAEDDVDSEDEVEDDDDVPPPAKAKAPAKPAPVREVARSGGVEVDSSSGCGGALISLIILLLAPVLGLCIHHYQVTGRFLLLDLLNHGGQ